MDEDEQKRIFCKNFRRLVDASGKGQNEIAKDLHFGYSSLNSWYRGVSMPNAAKILITCTTSPKSAQNGHF